MGKNNKKDNRDRYVHKNYDGFLSVESSNAPQNKTYQKKEPREKTAPVVPETAKELCKYFKDQIEAYEMFIQSGTDDLDMKKDLERKLLNIHPYPAEVSMGDEKLQMYLLDRNIKFNRDTHQLQRGSMIAVVLTGDGIPAYYINVYLTKDLIGNVNVAPITEKGTDFRNAARWSNRPQNSQP